MTTQWIAQGILIAALVGGSWAPTWAAVTIATIQRILLVEDSNLVYVYPTGGVVGAPSCHGSNGDYLSFSMSRPMAKQYLAAQARGATVGFRGKDVCEDQSMSETLLYFWVE